MRHLPIFCLALLAATPASAQSPGASLGGAPKPAPYAFNNPIPNVPGKSLLAVVVNYAPGAKNKSHRHAPSAFITAYVLEGAVRSQVDDGPVKVYHEGEYFTEKPGAHHMISENASQTESAKMLAIFVVDTGAQPLSTPDP